MDATIKSAAKHLKMRFCSFLGKCFHHKHMKVRNFVTELLFVHTIGESASVSGTAKAVKCFNIFNHKSWPENQEDLMDHGADDLMFLLDHFSTVLRR